MQFLDRMKRRWGVSLWGGIAILLSFSLAGMTVVRLKGPVLGLLVPTDASTWVSWVVYLLIIVPFYQLCLLIYGTLLGQYHFFWSRLRRLGQFLFGWLDPRSRSYEERPTSIDRRRSR